MCQPPLGILSLIAALRERLGERVVAGYHDLRLYQEDPEAFGRAVAGRYDLVGISALNHEARNSHRLARAIRQAAPDTLLVIGGPYARSAPERIRKSGDFDWIFTGESDRTFPEAVDRWFSGDRDLAGIPGISWREAPGAPYAEQPGDDSIPDLDALPMPAWDLVPFEVYARRYNMNGRLRAERYAPLFTSRGCPYKCNYCHDLFGKRFRWRSADSVMAEIDHLVETYGVREFQICDDIYNLHKPRMREIANRVIERYGERELDFCFPNGVRADIIDPEDLPLLERMGLYQMCVAVETVTPRLQQLIEKHLKIDHVKKVIARADALGITVKGFFMIGFPTETPQEIEDTVRFAVESKLTLAGFYLVVPQDGRPIHELARQENAEALERSMGFGYFEGRSWYQVAYGVDLGRIHRRAFARFYLRPSRFLRILRTMEWRTLRMNARILLGLTLLRMRPFASSRRSIGAPG